MAAAVGPADDGSMDDADLARTDLTREDARRIWSAQPVKVKTVPYSNMVQPPAAPCATRPAVGCVCAN
jgi:hypothetical protein